MQSIAKERMIHTVILTFAAPFVFSFYFIIFSFPPLGVTQAADYVTGQQLIRGQSYKEFSTLRQIHENNSLTQTFP